MKIMDDLPNSASIGQKKKKQPPKLLKSIVYIHGVFLYHDVIIYITPVNEVRKNDFSVAAEASRKPVS